MGFTPGLRYCTHFTGGWVGPRAGLDGCRKSRPPQGFDPRTVQPVASRCSYRLSYAGSLLMIIMYVVKFH